MARACPVPPGAVPLARQKSPHRTQNRKSDTSLARNQLPNTLRGAPCCCISLRTGNFVSAMRGLKPHLLERISGARAPHWPSKVHITRHNAWTNTLSQDRFSGRQCPPSPRSYHRQ
eukprot:gene25426-biopygen11996